MIHTSVRYHKIQHERQELQCFPGSCCRVLIEKLNGDLRRQEHRWTMAEQALRQLLEERQELNSRMVDTHR